MQGHRGSIRFVQKVEAGRTLSLLFISVSIGKASQGKGNTLELARLNNFGVGVCSIGTVPRLSGIWS